MATRVAWWMNLDVDLELSAPRHYQADATRERRIGDLLSRMTTLVRPDDVVLGSDELPEGLPVLAFCPSPHALQQLGRRGLVLAYPAPPLSVLQEANSRAFCARLGQTLRGASYAYDVKIIEQLSSALGPDQALVLKRAFGFAGRERRLLRAGPMDESTRGFVERSLRSGAGLQVEPWLQRLRDFALHGFLGVDGTLLVGPLMRQECDARGTWQSSREALPGELDEIHRRALVHELERSAEALHAVGYRGPFGIDAFEFRDAQGGLGFQPRSEINARFSMGYPRSLLERALRELCTGGS